MIKKLLPILLLCIASESFSQTHSYRFNGNLNAFGGVGPTLVEVTDPTCGVAPVGTNGSFTTESIVTAACTSGSPQSVFAFNESDGFSYPNSTGLGITTSYTISVLYRLNSYAAGSFGFQKLIDFNNGTSDNGLYSYTPSTPSLCLVWNNGIPIVPVTLTTPALSTTSYSLVTIVRDGVTNKVNIYINDVNVLTDYDDTGLKFVSNGTDPIIFFRDDLTAPVPCETGSGSVRYISISNAPSDATQVQTAWLGICSGVLPVTLTDFGAQRNNTDVSLQWQTSNQVNTSYFDVERSYDGQAFTAIARVSSKITTNSYAYTDVAALSLSNSNAFYRLKITDINGKYTYSSKVKVTYGANSKVSVFPNPATDVITISGLNSKDVVRVLTVDGKVLSQQTANVQSMIVNIGKYQPGTYIIQVKNDKEVTQQKFVKY